jgi:hypothetical protein
VAAGNSCNPHFVKYPRKSRLNLGYHPVIDARNSAKKAVFVLSVVLAVASWALIHYWNSADAKATKERERAEYDQQNLNAERERQAKEAFLLRPEGQLKVKVESAAKAREEAEAAERWETRQGERKLRTYIGTAEMIQRQRAQRLRDTETRRLARELAEPN